MRVVVGVLAALVLLVGGAAGASAQEDPYTGVLGATLERAQMSGCRGSDNVVQATGFQPGAEVTFTLDLGPAGTVTFTDVVPAGGADDGGLDGRAIADAEGVAAGSFRMPVDVEAGTYAIVVSGINELGSPDTLEIDLRVIDCGDGSDPGGSGPGGPDGGDGPGSDDLARTGSDLSGAARAALIVVALGLALVVAVRTRSTRPT